MVEFLRFMHPVMLSGDVSETELNLKLEDNERKRKLKTDSA